MKIRVFQRIFAVIIALVLIASALFLIGVAWNLVKQSVVDNYVELDLSSSQFKSFDPKRPMRYYTIIEDDTQRPDNLSLKLYGRMEYWWIVLKWNGIDDVWNDLTVGGVIKVPDILDIEDWILSL